MSTPADAQAPVRTVMVWPLATVHDDDTLRDAARALTEEEVGALLVVRREDRLIGLVSERDLVHAIAQDADLDEVVCGDVMALATISVAPDDTVAEAARLMSEARVRHLPVRDGERVVGMLSIRDVLDVLLAATAVA
ncbi:MAG TPA: CBS domain-containing protein [Jiangellales bacterium]|nr:CBS domain-containing protein [Jiangellales bacterium]